MSVAVFASEQKPRKALHLAGPVPCPRPPGEGDVSRRARPPEVIILPKTQKKDDPDFWGRPLVSGTSIIGS